MFLGKFLNLQGVYTFLILNYFKSSVFDEISGYYEMYNQFNYGYILEYVTGGVYSITNGYNIVYFTEEKILTIQEVIDINYNDINNSNSFN